MSTVMQKSLSLNLRQSERELRESDPDLLEEERSFLQTKGKNTSEDENLDHSHRCIRYPYRFVPLTMGGSNGRTHIVTDMSVSLMEEVSLEDLKVMTSKFYEKAFLDVTLDKFIHSHNDPHASRFAKWIHQKFSSSTLWDEDRDYRLNHSKPTVVAGGHRILVHDRSSAHVAAWNSTKRPSNQVGRKFKLDECRVWMRLHFWALRESGLIEKSPSFADYYLRFIAHFITVYESTAPMFARDSFRWSANPANIQQYLDNGRRMKDILGLTLGGAISQIPKYEVRDEVFPYSQTRDIHNNTN